MNEKELMPSMGKEGHLQRFGEKFEKLSFNLCVNDL